MIRNRVENVSNFRLKDVEIVWGEPYSDQWRTDLVVQNARGLTLDGVAARQAPGSPESPAILLKDVAGGVVKSC